MKDAKRSTANLHGGVHTPYSTGPHQKQVTNKNDIATSEALDQEMWDRYDAIEKILLRLKEKKGSKLDEEEQELFRQQVVSCAEFKAKEYPDLNRPGSGMELVPCRPHLGECPPLETRREMPWAEVYVKAVDIDKDGTITPYNAPCVLKSAILSPMDAIQAKQMDELADTLMQVHKALPLIKKRRDFVNAIKECSTLRTEELCGAPKTDQGTTKCRVAGHEEHNKNLVLCKPTLAYLNEQQEDAASRYSEIKGQLESIDHKLKAEKFKKFEKNMTAIPANAKDRKDKEEKDNLERERAALVQRKILLRDQAGDRSLEILNEQEAFNFAAANDAICQNRKRSNFTKRNECIRDANDNMCIIARHGLGGADYIETIDKDGDEFLKNDMCVSSAGKGLTHAKDKKTGKVVFRDAKNRIVRNVYGKSPEWWNAVNNRVIAKGLGEHFGTGLAGVKADLEHWGDDKALARDDAVSYWFAEVMRAQNAILATIENLVIAKKQEAELTHTKDEKLLKGLKEAIDKWEAHLDKLVKEMQENAPEQLASLSGHLIRQKGADAYKDGLIDTVTKEGRKSQAFALAHDIAMRYAADKFTNGEVVRYFPRGDRDVQGWAYGEEPVRVVVVDDNSGKDLVAVQYRGMMLFVGRYHLQKLYILGDPERKDPTVDGILAGFENEKGDHAIHKIRIADGTVTVDPNMEIALTANLSRATSTGILSKIWNSLPTLFSTQKKSLQEYLDDDITMDDIDQLQKYLEALTSALEQNLRAKGMDLSYGGMYMRSVSGKGSSDDIMEFIHRSMEESDFTHRFLDDSASLGEESIADDVSLMSTDEESIGDISLMSTEGAQTVGNISLMSTDEESIGDISLMSTEGVQTVGDISLMSTEGGRSVGDISLMSTEGAQTVGDISLMSTEGGRTEGEQSVAAEEEFVGAEAGNISFMSVDTNRTPSLMSTDVSQNASSKMSTEGSSSKMMSTEGSSSRMMSTEGLMSTEGSSKASPFVASMGDSYVQPVDSFSVPSVKSVAASSVDVDQMYEEYYATNSATSSVSHL